MDHDPTRLLESTELSPTVRALLERGRARPAVDYDVAAGVARFHVSLEGAPSGQSLTRRLWNFSKAAKLALFLVACLSLVATLFLITPSPPASPQARAAPSTRGFPQPFPAQTAPAADSGEASARVRPALSSAEPQPSTTPAAEPLHNAPAVRVRAVKRGPPAPAARRSHQRPNVAPPPALPDRVVAAPPLAVASRPVEVTSDVSQSSVDSIDELRAIAQARRLMANEPQTALALLERLTRAHPKGYFVEEREALRVLALSAAGRSDQAERYAESFLRAYPNSPFADRIRTIAEH